MTATTRSTGTAVDAVAVERGRRVLRMEREALAETERRLGDEFARAVALVARSPGRVIVAGVGKSGLIGRKIAATLTSTGTPATFLHPVDGVHGDLGLVGPQDVAILLSKSGGTEEVLSLLQHLQRLGVRTIAITGNAESPLARHADVALDGWVSEEACPHDLAPTTSTTVALALGDALAMTLMQVKGLTPDDFAVNHPAGQLGKRLTLTVADLMHSGEDNPTIALGAVWVDAVKGISAGGLGAVTVVDDAGRLMGIITDGDLRRAIQKSDPASLAKLRSDELMTRNPAVASPELLAYDALRLMEDRPSQISVLPVVDGDRVCVGLIRLHDIVRSGL